MARRRTIGFALLGAGKLGLGFYAAWKKKHEKILEKTGIDLVLKRILVKNPLIKRPSFIDPALFTTKLDDILEDDSIKLVIDAIGGIEPIFSIIKKIISHNINVVSANRVLLATKMHELSNLANEHHIHFLTEPALGGGLPIAAIIQRDLVANKITQLYGVVSGVSNYILGKMSENNTSMRQTLKDSRIMEMGESLAIIDYTGADSAMKVAILAATAFGVDINYLDIYSEGISKVTLSDVQWARNFGYEIKLLVILRDHEASFEARVQPTLVPINHPLTTVKGEYNACYIKTDLLGEYMVYGRGVGTDPTCSLILRDLVDIANRIYNNPRRQRFYFNWNIKPLLEMSKIVTAYYLRFPCIDKPGVMGEITREIGSQKINITSAHAEVNKKKGISIGYVHIFVDNAQEEEVFMALDAIKKLNLVRGEIRLFRILDDVQNTF